MTAMDDKRIKLKEAGIRCLCLTKKAWLLQYKDPTANFPVSLLMNTETNIFYAYGKRFKADLDALIIAIKAGKITFPAGTEIEPCQHCGQDVHWVNQSVAAGNNSRKDTANFDRLNPDGTLHELLCRVSPKVKSTNTN